MTNSNEVNPGIESLTSKEQAERDGIDTKLTFAIICVGIRTDEITGQYIEKYMGTKAYKECVLLIDLEKENDPVAGMVTETDTDTVQGESAGNVAEGRYWQLHDEISERLLESFNEKLSDGVELISLSENQVTVSKEIGDNKIYVTYSVEKGDTDKNPFGNIKKIAYFIVSTTDRVFQKQRKLTSSPQYIPIDFDIYNQEGDVDITALEAEVLVALEQTLSEVPYLEK